MRCISRKWNNLYKKAFPFLPDDEKPSIRLLDRLFFERKQRSEEMKDMIRRVLGEYLNKNETIGKKLNDPAIRLSIVSDFTDLIPRLIFHPHWDFLDIAFRYSKYETIMCLLNKDSRVLCRGCDSWRLMKEAMKREDSRISQIIISQCECGNLSFPSEPLDYPNGFLCGKTETQVENILDLHTHFVIHKKGFSIYYTTNSSTFLKDAVNTGNVNIVKLITEHVTQNERPIQISIGDISFLTAIENGYVDIMEYLLNFRKEISEGTEKIGIEWASIKATKHTASVQFLIKNNLFDARHYKYWPLREALERSNIKMVRMILALCPELTKPSKREKL